MKELRLPEKQSTEEIFVREIDFDANKAKIIRENWLEKVESSVESKELAGLLPCVHGTTVDRLLSIIRDKTVISHRSLGSVHPDIQNARLENATDELDISIGLDAYVFLGVGRVHPVDVQESYVLFPPNLVREPDSFVSLREIVHYGALVSPEAKSRFKRKSPGASPDLVNKHAVNKFFLDLLKGTDFEEIFPKFLNRYRLDYVEYAASPAFPDVPLTPGSEVNGWEGPQLIVPGDLSLDKSAAILLTGDSRGSFESVLKSGYPRDKIFRMSDFLAYFKIKGYPVEVYKNPSERYPFINLALREIMILQNQPQQRPDLIKQLEKTRGSCRNVMRRV